jgi:hypothetical protein
MKIRLYDILSIVTNLRNTLAMPRKYYIIANFENSVIQEFPWVFLIFESYLSSLYSLIDYGLIQHQISTTWNEQGDW